MGDDLASKHTAFVFFGGGGGFFCEAMMPQAIKRGKREGGEKRKRK